MAKDTWWGKKMKLFLRYLKCRLGLLLLFAGLFGTQQVNMPAGGGSSFPGFGGSGRGGSGGSDRPSGFSPNR